MFLQFQVCCDPDFASSSFSYFSWWRVSLSYQEYGSQMVAVGRGGFDTTLGVLGLAHSRHHLRLVPGGLAQE